MLEKCLNLTEPKPSTQYPCQKENFVNTSKKVPRKSSKKLISNILWLIVVRVVLVTKLFPLLFFDRYILAIQQIITFEEHLRCSFWLQWPCELPQSLWHHSHNPFHYVIPDKSHNFPLFWCLLCTATSDISSSNIKK